MIKTYRKKWVPLSNGYWLKILVLQMTRNMRCYAKNIYMLDICVGKTKRIVNDHYNSKRRSPKSLFQKSSNNKGGIEVYLKTLDYIDELKSILPKGSILRIEGSDDKRKRAYKILLRHGFKSASFYDPYFRWHKEIYYFLEI